MCLQQQWRWVSARSPSWSNKSQAWGSCSNQALGSLLCSRLWFLPPQVVFCMDRALEFAPACHRFKILKAECLALLGRYPEAQSVAR